MVYIIVRALGNQKRIIIECRKDYIVMFLTQLPTVQHEVKKKKKQKKKKQMRKGERGKSKFYFKLFGVSKFSLLCNHIPGLPAIFP